MKKADPKVNFYKCPICQTTCGTRSGTMPPGTMKWKKAYGKIDGHSDADGMIQIDYRFEAGTIPGTR